MNIVIYLLVVLIIGVGLRFIHRKYNGNYQIRGVFLHAAVDTVFIYIFNSFNIYSLVTYFYKDFIDYDYIIPKLNGLLPLLLFLPIYIIIKWVFSKKRPGVIPVSKYVIDEFIIFALSNYGTLLILYFIMTVIFGNKY